MDKLVIRGGRRLKGVVEISGAKNAALPIMAASLLASGSSIIKRVPNLRDIHTAGQLIKHLGAEFSYGDKKAAINTERIRILEAPYELVRTMRASVLVLGPLLARFGNSVHYVILNLFQNLIRTGLSASNETN